jgi:hypothetical protein
MDMYGAFLGLRGDERCLLWSDDYDVESAPTDTWQSKF